MLAWVDFNNRQYYHTSVIRFRFYHFYLWIYLSRNWKKFQVKVVSFLMSYMIIHWHNFQGFQLFFSFESKCFSMGRGEHGAKWEKWGNIFYVSGKPKYLCENDAILQAQRKCHLMVSSLISSINQNCYAKFYSKWTSFYKKKSINACDMTCDFHILEEGCDFSFFFSSQEKKFKQLIKLGSSRGKINKLQIIKR